MENRLEGQLHIENLSAGYGRKVIVDNVTIELVAGEILSIIGPNGAGKSTFLKSLIGLLKPFSGKVTYMDRSLSDMDAGNRAKLMSVLLTSKVDVSLMTVRDVVSMGRYPYTGKLGRLGVEDNEVIDRCMADTHITELSMQDFETLSDGQKQRVMLARALCQEPEILVLDEPTSYLDIRYTLEFVDIIRCLARERGTIVIMSIHELDLARKVSDKVLCLKDGHIDNFGKPDEIFAEGYIERLYDIPKEYSRWLK